MAMVEAEPRIDTGLCPFQTTSCNASIPLSMLAINSLRRVILCGTILTGQFGYKEAIFVLNLNEAAACKFHSGKSPSKNGHAATSPLSPNLVPRANITRLVTILRENSTEDGWNLFSTPPSHSLQSVAAVVIDCEMRVAEWGESELIRVSPIDYFSRKVLFNSLVWPSVKMMHYNTRFSGIHRGAMLENARRHCKCLFGRDEARRAVFKFIGRDTIVIAHARYQQDLASLRWIHTVMVDTLIIEKLRRQQEGPSLPGQPVSAAQDEVSGLSLKTLAWQIHSIYWPRSLFCRGRTEN
ncbi:hypothetical protein CDD81_2610 [Ophiocordyceps australis]|uniref:Exonuclease domain-containing protein n=1 Tax=Ophiocordyceps australis TaxID=1399860 RepID=A0A2C5XXQ7_9HYPO|nr:hypothetical protein CDD81_2610 [Ophiocordyceps australis]